MITTTSYEFQLTRCCAVFCDSLLTKKVIPRTGTMVSLRVCPVWEGVLIFFERVELIFFSELYD